MSQRFRLVRLAWCLLALGWGASAIGQERPILHGASYLPLDAASPSYGVMDEASAPFELRFEFLDASGNPLPRASSEDRETRLHIRAVDRRGETVDISVDLAFELEGALPRSGKVPLRNGEAVLKWEAPPHSQTVIWRIEGLGESHRGVVNYEAVSRPLLMTGVLETVVRFDQRQEGGLGAMDGLSDGLEASLRQWVRRFHGGRGSAAAQSSVYLEGDLTEALQVTAVLDSERPRRQRAFRNYNPDRLNPVLGDSAERGFLGRSADRVYLRLDRGEDYLLYGDFATGSGFSLLNGGGSVPQQRLSDLGQYNRTMTGVRGRRSFKKGSLDGFAMRDSLRQAVEEYRGNGTSGPFAVENSRALENSEKVEVIVRDRDNPSRILSTRMLVRYADYTFEPFSGRILLKAPLSAVDDALNPVSLRITYEVDTGGEAFWVYGVTASRELAPGLTVGGSLVRNENPSDVFTPGFGTNPGSGQGELTALYSAHLAFDRGPGAWVLESAQSVAQTSAGEINGEAVRVAWSGGSTGVGAEWTASMFLGAANASFFNPSSSLAGGRQEAGATFAKAFFPDLRLSVETHLSADQISGGERAGSLLELTKDLSEILRGQLRLRHFLQRNGGVGLAGLSGSALALPGQSAAYGGAGLNPNGAGFWGQGLGVDPITGQPLSLLNGTPLPGRATAEDVNAISFSAGLLRDLSDRWTLGAIVGHDQGFEDDPSWVALDTRYALAKGALFARVEAPTGRATAGGEIDLTESVNLYSRYEQRRGLSSAYAIDDSARSRAFVLGLRRRDHEGNNLHSELRLREGMNEQELEAVSGLSNTFELSERIALSVLAERLEILEGGSRGATALGSGIEFTDEHWLGLARLEWRRLDADRDALENNEAQSVMSELSLARKLSDRWTGLLRNYLLATDDASQAGHQWQNRFQAAAAFRPSSVGTADWLFRFEHKNEGNDELPVAEARSVHILSSQLNWHPSAPLWSSIRLAAKDLDERLGGVRDRYQAYLFSTRTTFDVTERIDLGMMAATMASAQGQAQESAYGVEVGYRLKRDLWASLGYNFAGFFDRDLAGQEQTQEGWYLRLRMKFDEGVLAPWQGRFAPSS